MDEATAHLKLLVVCDQALHVSFDHLTLNVRESIDTLHMVAHCVNILPTSHRIGADATVSGA